MGLSGYELDRLADDIYKDRKITGSVYCGTCGYNLHTLPYVYTCPECGNPYNARPLLMRGIFTPHEIEFPFRDIAASLACAACTIFLAAGALRPVDVIRLGLAIVCAAFTVTFVWQAYFRLERYFKSVAIARRIAADEKELEEE